MKPLSIRRLLLALAACFFVNVAYAAPVTYDEASLSIQTHDGVVRYTVALALTDAQHEYGLMNRHSLPPHYGMLFDFRKPQPVTMWMKDTYIPLDMVFINQNGIITRIAQNAKPESLDIISSQGDVRAVLELMGGDAQHYHIAPGDKVIYPIFP